jgi:hypothetical protein
VQRFVITVQNTFLIKLIGRNFLKSICEGAFWLRTCTLSVTCEPRVNAANIEGHCCVHGTQAASTGKSALHTEYVFSFFHD